MAEEKTLRLTAKNAQTIEAEHHEPTFFAMIPKMAIMDLDPYELALYCNYKQTVGENGGARVTKTNATIARETHMSVNRMKAARDTLIKKRYIEMTTHEDSEGNINQPPTITVRDIWSINHQIYSVSLCEGVSNYDTPVSPDDTPPPPSVTPPLSRGDTKEEHNKNNQIKDSAADAAKPAKTRKPRAPKPDPETSKAVGAVIKAWKDALPAEPISDVYQNRGIRKVAEEIHKAGYTPEQVMRYMEAQYEEPFWRGKYMKLEHVALNLPIWLASHNGVKPTATDRGHLDGILAQTREREARLAVVQKASA